MMTKHEAEEKQGVCLVLEPRHPGRREWGEPWLFEVVRSLPQETFTLVLVGAGEPGEERTKNLPENVAEVLVCDPPEEGEGRDGGNAARRAEERALRKTRSKWLSHKKVAPLIEVLGKMAHEGSATRQDLGRAFRELSRVAPLYRFELLWRDALGWELLSEASRRSRAGLPFGEFCGLVRGLVEPLWRVFGHSARVPEARVYHAVGGLRAGLFSLVLGKTRRAATLFTDNRILPGQFAADHFRDLLAAGAGEGPGREEELEIQLGWRERLHRFVLAHTDTLVSSDPLAAETLRGTCGLELEKEVHHLPVGDARRENGGATDGEEKGASGRDGTGAFAVGGVFGRVRESDVRCFLEAAAGVDRQTEQCCFTLWGKWKDPDRAFYAAMAEGFSRAMEVEFADRDEFAERVGALDLAVLPSQQEAGGEILEACFGAGVPVAAAGLDKFSGLLRSLETDGADECFVRVDLGDTAGMEEAMLNLLSDHRRRQAMAAAAKETVSGGFDHGEMVAGYRRLYQLDEEVADE